MAIGESLDLLVTPPERWQQLVGELSSLFTQTLHRGTRLEQIERDLAVTKARNEVLEKRVKKLERDIEVWRQAHERESVAKEAVVAAKDGLHRELTSIKEDAPLIVCLIDGDGTIFTQEYLSQGHAGGESAAQALRRGMLEFLAPAGTRATVCATICCNRTGLRDALNRAGTCTGPQFDAFWIGFQQAASTFYLVDVGPGKEAADAKLRDALRMYARMPQVLRVFFGGAHDGGYRPPLAALALEGFINKVVLIQAHNEIAYDLRSMKLQAVHWDGIFMPQKLILPGQSNAQASSSNTAQPPPNISMPSSPAPTHAQEPPSGMRYVDPKIPLGKHVPPPCNFHYLLSNCTRGDNCPYAHNFVLTAGQLQGLRRAAKSSPCVIANRNQKCPHGAKCCMSHKCPHAADCPQLKAGKCKFTAKGMHDQPVAPASPAASHAR